MKRYARRQKKPTRPAEAHTRVPRVFISYSHDSSDHSAAVLSLANRLRTDGIDAVLDQYEQSPPFGWPYWMEEQIRTADFVLIVCSKLYRRHVEHFESISGAGKGVLWESNIIYNELYIDRLRNAKYVPILFARVLPENIPTPLKGFTYYNPETAAGYEALYRRIVGDPLIRRPPLGPRKRSHNTIPDMGEIEREEAAERKGWLRLPIVKTPKPLAASFSEVTIKALSSTELPANMANVSGLVKSEGRAFLTQKLGTNVSLWNSGTLNATIALLDLDKLTQVNKSFGTRVGDAVLYAVYQILSHSQADYSGRCGDDTFYAVYLYIPEERAERLVRELCEDICHFEWNALAAGLRITCSVGLAHFDKEEPADDWPIRAAIGMRKAKDDGGNRVSKGPSLLPLAEGTHNVSRELTHYFS